MNTPQARQLVKTVDRLARRLELVEDEAWIRDRGWRFLFTNTSFSRHHGESPSTLEGRLDRELFTDPEVRVFRRDDRRCAEAMAPSFFAEDSPPHHGSHETLKFPLLLPTGAVIGVVGIGCRAPRPEPSTRPPRWLRGIKRRISTGFAGPVSVRRWAGWAGVHPDHLGRSFKHHYGMSVHDFVRRLRVQWSCWAMLEDPGRRLGDLAIAAGFSDQSHFTREFRRIRGVSPGAFRDLTATDRGAASPVRLSSMGRALRPAGSDRSPEGSGSEDRCREPS